ncbi:MAG: peroxide stress protein YaaA [Coprococcus sp.]|nr:peroxide stress protein YaaA [Coprococcus sp.]
MKIILSPAKKMKIDTDSPEPLGLPVYIDRTEQIMSWLKNSSRDELKKLWGCSDKIVDENVERLGNMDLRNSLTPAVLAYEGIAYQYMAPAVFEYGHFNYVQEHLCILSAFYGVLKAMDGVTPYRLEMQAKAHIDGTKNLYEFWGRDLYDAVIDDSRIIINLASKEYSKCIEKYVTTDDRFITISFCENVSGRLVTKGTYAKMARGEMVRFMAENNVQTPDELMYFDRLGYIYRKELSNPSEYVFVKG